MNEQTIKLIEQLAQKLGTTSEYLWGVLLLQAKVAAIEGLMFSCITLAYLVFYTLKIMNKKSFLYDGDEDLTFVGFAASLIAAVSAFVLVFSISETITAIFNPEYYALKIILRFLQ